VKSDLAVSRSYVDLRTDPAAEQRGAEALGATMVSGPMTQPMPSRSPIEIGASAMAAGVPASA
jgi:hypothetical protein